MVLLLLVSAVGWNYTPSQSSAPGEGCGPLGLHCPPDLDVSSAGCAVAAASRSPHHWTKLLELSKYLCGEELSAFISAGAVNRRGGIRGFAGGRRVGQARASRLPEAVSFQNKTIGVVKEGVP